MKAAVTTYVPVASGFDLDKYADILPLLNVVSLDFYVHGKDEVAWEITVKSDYARQALTLSSMVDSDDFEVVNEDGRDVGIHLSDPDRLVLMVEKKKRVHWSARDLMNAVNEIAVKENLGA